MNHLKELTPEAVVSVANKLMKKYGTTTTLDVKKALRRQGYFALQEDVSAWMDALSFQERWVFDFNGSFRLYRRLSVNQWILMIAPPISVN